MIVVGRVLQSRALEDGGIGCKMVNDCFRTKHGEGTIWWLKRAAVYVLRECLQCISKLYWGNLFAPQHSSSLKLVIVTIYCIYISSYGSSNFSRLHITRQAQVWCCTCAATIYLHRKTSCIFALVWMPDLQGVNPHHISLYTNIIDRFY